MKNLKYLLILAFIIFFLWTFMGCNTTPHLSSQLTPTLSPAPQSTVIGHDSVTSVASEMTPINIIPTPTNLIDTPHLLTPVSTLSASGTALINIIPTPTTPHLLTPVGTLSASEVQALLLELHETKSNIDCRLPCWWGFIPGQTTWEEVEQTLTLLGSEIYFYDWGNNMSMSEVIISVSEGGQFRQLYTVNNGMVEMIETVVSLRNPAYSVSSFLNSYGHPSEVRLDTYGYIREGGLPFNLLMFYPDQGLLIRYDVEATEENNIVYGCPQNKPALVIAVWDPNQKLTFEEALNKTIEMAKEKDYKLLEEATDMNVETFFDTFVNPDTKTCIETPSEFWSSS